MSFDTSSQEPPAKKRRFFQDPDTPSSDDLPESVPEWAVKPTSPGSPGATLAYVRAIRAQDERDGRSILAEMSHNGTPDQASSSQAPPPPTHKHDPSVFNQDMFESFVGDKVQPDVLEVLRELCGTNLEKAVNMYFDGTYKNKLNNKRAKIASPFARSSAVNAISSTPKRSPTSTPDSSTPPPARIPRERYVGAFGVEGWVTRSGSNLLKHGDVIQIEREKAKPPPAARGRGGRGGGPVSNVRGAAAVARRNDVIIRFKNPAGIEVGRIEKGSSSWISALIDQKLCKFEGSVVYAPDTLRTNDTVFLQLRCYMLNTAFFHKGFQLADDRKVSPFEQEETTDEKKLRLRQTALVRLFQEVNIQPTAASAKASEGRKGLLKAAEKDEKVRDNNTNNNGSSSPNEEEEEEEDGQELEQDQLDALYKKAQSFDFDTPETEPADTFAMTLRPYQKQALHWMMAKEKDEKSRGEPSMHPLWEEYTWPTKDVDDTELPSFEQDKFYVNPYSGDLSLDFPEQEQHCLGGILADEMGLGKTIQMLSLVHSHRSDVALQAKRPLKAPSMPISLPRMNSNASNVVDAPCTTLVVAPMSLLAQWKSESEKASEEGTLKIELYYGAEKSNNLQALCSASNAAHAPDVVITSYGIVLSEFASIAAKQGDKSFHNGIFSLRFFRVILDEGHHIKNRASKTAKACYEISSIHRWVLTGTPIVNRLEDLFSLVRFLGVEPWNNFSFWRTFITVPFEAGEFVRALDVVQTVLEPLVMRRTKDMNTPDGQPLVPLPPKQIDIINVELSKTEREVYDWIYLKAKSTFSSNVDAGTVLKAYTTIFAQILRLRQTCCHPLLVRNHEMVADEEAANAAADVAAGLSDNMDLDALLDRFAEAVDEAAEEKISFGTHALTQIREESEKECPLCFEEPMNDQLVTGCWHSACKACLLDYIKHERDRDVIPRCFNCREQLNVRDLFEVVRHEGEPDPFSKKPKISLQRLGANTSSAKIVALLSELRALRRDHPKMKSVIFSQFTSFLNIIEPVLTRANIKFLRLDGTMAQKARAAVLQEFQDGKGFMVLLISLRAGGVGLNLTSAGRVFMMDPWWSFAVEAQAIDRVHRMGQMEEVMVKRFVVKDSVEERMLKVQDRKKFIATSLGMMSDEEKKTARIEDIKELLS